MTLATFGPRQVAYCDNPDGLGLAADWFGLSADDVKAQAGEYEHGGRKGKARGAIVYTTCEHGGHCEPLGRQVLTGETFARFTPTYSEMSHNFTLPECDFLPACVAC